MAEPSDTGEEVCTFSQVFFTNASVFKACEDGNLSHVYQYIKNGGDINIQTEVEQETLLHICARNRHVSIMLKLLESGSANVNLVDRHGNTCLHNAAVSGLHIVVCDIIRAGADVNKPNAQHERALHLAAEYGHAKCTAMLLRNGADVTLIDAHALTAISRAIAWNCPDVVDVLVEHYRQSSSKEKEQDLILDLTSGLLDTLAHGQKELALKLANHGALCDAHVNNTQITALHVAVKEDVIDIIPFCQNLNALCCEGAALHIAIRQRNIVMVEKLLEGGADPDIRQEGLVDSPLHMAAGCSFPEAFLLLLKRGANAMVLTSTGKTALDVYFKEDPETVKDCILTSETITTNKSYRYAVLKLVLRENSVELTNLTITMNILMSLKLDSAEDFNWLVDQTIEKTNTSVMKKIIEFWCRGGCCLDYVKHKFFQTAVMNYVMDKNSVSVTNYILTDEYLRELSRENAVEFNILLHRACKECSNTVFEKIFSFCKREEIDPSIITEGLSDEPTSLLHAVYYNNSAIANFFAQFSHILFKKRKPTKTVGFEALEKAVMMKSLAIVKTLLKAGIKPKTSLLRCIEFDSHNDVSKLLVEHGASVNGKVWKCGLTLLQYAIVKNNREIVKFLLSEGAQTRVVAQFGFTPLHDAVWRRDLEIVRQITRAGCDLSAQISAPSKFSHSIDGSTALHLATRASHLPIVRHLLLCGAAVRMFDNTGKTCLELAMCKCPAAFIATLLSAGEDLANIPDDIEFDSEKELEDKDDGERTVAILKSCGFRFSEGESEDESDDEGDNTISRPIKTFEPLPLQDICATTIRLRLNPNAWCSVGALPLPNLIKSYITFGIMDDECFGQCSESEDNSRVLCRLDIHSKRRLFLSDPILFP